MENKNTNSNAKLALNMMKMEIANELGYDYNQVTDKIESNAPQNTLSSTMALLPRYIPWSRQSKACLLI